ncbi:ATP-binding cassette domain-containing protein [Propylenella binzhouense]|uniref:ATP-binding cassette domain-containing protein n=1 Tax=Propylenella binzhouense TaxID=2555902 RepID=A0A964T3R5_9HYPH|nr:ATP-binding cassette domain-containing protein [Propylenella binzhouense]MYZ47387.1 ATP-binding cassette domain-containing protein [Propylenella binzhouense]
MLVLRSVKARLGGVLVLRDVDLAVEAGRTTVLVGRNGAGKTTTLRVIMGLVPLAAGRVAMAGTDLGALPSHARAAAGIGYAPEDRRLIPAFSVEDNLLLPALALRLPSAERRARLDQVYDLLPELKAMRGRAGGHLSGGQGKMVALGRALMVGTRLVLLDEPFQGLAPALALAYAEAIGRIRSRMPELALLITESSPHLLDRIVDRTVQIERGEIVRDTVPAA